MGSSTYQIEIVTMRSDFCIIGGGVSGLMTALLLERYLPTKKIVLIYSPKQKEIGVMLDVLSLEVVGEIKIDVALSQC